MPTNFPDRKSKDCCNASEASLCYKIALSCPGKIDVYDANACNGALSLVPGLVTNDSNLSCSPCGSEIIVHSCESHASEQCSVPIEPPCQRICDNFIKDSGQDSCRVNSCCIWTSTDKQVSSVDVCIGDTVTYTITFTNYSDIALDMVFISDDVPAGLTVIPDSIHPAPKPGETLQSGVSIGGVPAGQSVSLIYKVTVDCNAPCRICNCASAKYYYTDCRGCTHCGTGSCKSCVITLKNRCLCQCVCRCFSLCSFSRLRYCRIYNKSVKNYKTELGNTLIVGFDIAVKYIDLEGKKRNEIFENFIIFNGLCDDFFSDRSDIHFINFVYNTDCSGNLTVQFTAQLCSQNIICV